MEHPSEWMVADLGAGFKSHCAASISVPLRLSLDWLMYDGVHVWGWLHKTHVPIDWQFVFLTSQRHTHTNRLVHEKLHEKKPPQPSIHICDLAACCALCSRYFIFSVNLCLVIRESDKKAPRLQWRTNKSQLALQPFSHMSTNGQQPLIMQLMEISSMAWRPGQNTKSGHAFEIQSASKWRGDAM